MRRKLACLGTALALIAVSSGCAATVRPAAAYAPPPEIEAFSYEDWGAVLSSSVDDAGLVDYAGLQADPEHLERFYALVAAFSPDSAPDLFPSASDRLAYWINAYNAAAMRLVLFDYPIASVNDVPPPAAHFFVRKQGAGFFYFQKAVFGGRATSLYKLEFEHVLPRFPDPRIHFALNCASMGCPRLPRAPFLSGTLDEDLDREAREFFAEERNLAIDDGARTITLSQILEWYESDFTDWLREKRPDRPATLLEYVALHVDEGTAEKLRGEAAGYAVEFRPYDWRLNEQR